MPNEQAPNSSVARRFEVRNSADGGNAEIYLYNSIGDFYQGVTAKAFIDAVNALNPVPKTLTLNINSPGGSVYDADAIFNFLQRHPAAKVCNVDGLAASAACTVAMACATRNIAQNAMMMVHNVEDFAFGDADEMRQTADRIEKLDKTVCDTYARATGQTPEKCAQMMEEETWMGAEDAKALGFATAIVGEKKAAALAGFTPASLAGLHYKHADNLSPFLTSCEPVTKDTNAGPAPDEEKVNNLGQEKKTGTESGGAAAEPINLAEHVKTEGKRFMDAFGAENGAKYFATGMMFEAAQNQHVADLGATNKALTDKVADLEKKLAASNAALGVDPLSADADQSDPTNQTTDEQKKYDGLLKAFKGDEVRAKRAFNSWKEHRDRVASKGQGKQK